MDPDSRICLGEGFDFVYGSPLTVRRHHTAPTSQVLTTDNLMHVKAGPGMLQNLREILEFYWSNFWCHRKLSTARSLLLS